MENNDWIKTVPAVKGTGIYYLHESFSQQHWYLLLAQVISINNTGIYNLHESFLNNTGIYYLQESFINNTGIYYLHESFPNQQLYIKWSYF